MISYDRIRRETDWESFSGVAKRHPPDPPPLYRVDFLALMLEHDKQIAWNLLVGRWKTTMIPL